MPSRNRTQRLPADSIFTLRLQVDRGSIFTYRYIINELWGGAAVLRPVHIKTGHQSYVGRIENWKNKILIQILNFMFFRYKKIKVFHCLFWCEIILLLFEVEFFQFGSKGWSRADFLPWYDKSGFNPTNLLSKAKMAWTLLLSRLGDGGDGGLREQMSFCSKWASSHWLISSTEHFSIRLQRRGLAFRSQHNDVKIQLYAMWHWILCKCFGGSLWPNSHLTGCDTLSNGINIQV